MGKTAEKISLKGKRFGRWVVEGDMHYQNNQRMWECICDCGTRKYVNEGNLIRGKTLSCGCIARENTKKRIRNLTGQRFGYLVVENQAPNKNGRVAWNCVCDCGEHCVVTGHDLVLKHTGSCGSGIHRVGKYISDIQGNEYGRLTVLYPTGDRDYKGSVMWYCRCRCGNELLVSQDALVNGGKKSCGCLKREIGERLHGRLHFEGGTCVEFLKRRKARSDSQTQIRGVTETKDHKFISYIGFKGARYYLGRFDNLAEAVSARTDARKAIHEAYIREYHDWLSKNDGNIDGFAFHVNCTTDGFVIETNGEMDNEK